MSRGRRVAIVLTPLLAIGTLAVGMAVGARRPVHAAVVYGAPRARGSSVFAWQVVTFADDTGGRETEARSGLTIRARSRAHGQPVEATWKGDSNEDGVAEVRLDLPGVERGDPIELEVRVEGSDAALAQGRAAWDDAAWMDAAPAPFVRASKRVGPIALDVAVLGGKLSARTDVPLLLRATSREDGRPLAGIVVTPEPEPGLDARQATVTTCPLGWARLDVSAKIYVAALGLHAKAADGRAGDWYAGLPVATGSIHAVLPDVVRPSDGASSITVQGETGIYTELDDDEGRALATWSKLPDASGNRASIALPGLPPGLKWLVTASEPRAAELPDEATIVRPFLVAGASMPIGLPRADDACGVLAYLAMHPAGGFHRSTLLDGSVARRDANGERKKRGLAIGLGALVVGAALELFLVIQSARSGRKLAVDASDGIEDASALMRRSSAGSVIIGLLLAVLGFALIGALLLLKT